MQVACWQVRRSEINSGCVGYGDKKSWISALTEASRDREMFLFCNGVGSF